MYYPFNPVKQFLGDLRCLLVPLTPEIFQNPDSGLRLLEDPISGPTPYC